MLFFKVEPEQFVVVLNRFTLEMICAKGPDNEVDFCSFVSTRKKKQKMTLTE